MRGAGRALAAASAVALGAIAGLRAQERSFVHEENERQICSVKVTPFGGSVHLGGCGFVLVDAQNHDQKPHALQVLVQSRTWASNDVGLSRSLLLGPEERGRFFLPLPNTVQVNCELTITIDTTKLRGDLQLVPSRGIAGLLVSDRPQATPSALAVVQAAATPFAAREKPQVVPCNTLDLPADWRNFTGFALVLVDGRSRVGSEAQQALRRYAFAGGRVLVASAPSLPMGALRERLEALAGVAVVPHGLGFLVALPSFEPDASGVADLFATLPPTGLGLWPLPQPLHAPQVVPGLDGAPVLVFLTVILLFAVLAGPVNFLLVRRWRRPLLVLVTVPALGFGTTVLMLGFAFLNDGFGIRGAVRTWSLLDQGNHEAVTIGARTLFAGLSPAAVQVADDALVLAPAAFFRRDRRSVDRWHFDADRNVLDGGVLPSRTTSVLVDARQGTARQRLQARLRPDGALDLLLDGGVLPQGVVLLRDPDGDHWLGEAPLLRRCSAAEAAAALGRFLGEAGPFPIETGPDQDPEVADLARIPERALRGGELPRGSYCTRVAATPWASEHGLSITYDAAAHFLVGHLGAEDFQR